MANFPVVAGRYGEAKKYAAEALELAVDFRASVTIALGLQMLAVQAVAGGRIAQLERSGACAAKLCGFAEAQMAAFALPKIYGLTEDYDHALEMLRDARTLDLVRRLHRYYRRVRLVRFVRHRLRLSAFPKRTVARATVESEDLPVPVQGTSVHAWGIRPHEVDRPLAFARPFVLPSANAKASAPRLS